jgi:hypothetical protein
MWVIASVRGPPCGPADDAYVVEAEPALEPAGELGGFEGHRRPKLIQGGAQDPLDLAVQVGRARPVGPELDASVAQAVLDLVREELPATVGLYALHRERHAGAQLDRLTQAACYPA